MNNNAARQSASGFCIGKKKWGMVDTVAVIRSSAIIYSIAETAKANGLKTYDYFEYLLTGIPKHLDETNRSFLDNLIRSRFIKKVSSFISPDMIHFLSRHHIRNR